MTVRVWNTCAPSLSCGAKYHIPIIPSPSQMITLKRLVLNLTNLLILWCVKSKSKQQLIRKHVCTVNDLSSTCLYWYRDWYVWVKQPVVCTGSYILSQVWSDLLTLTCQIARSGRKLSVVAFPLSTSPRVANRVCSAHTSIFPTWVLYSRK